MVIRNKKRFYKTIFFILAIAIGLVLLMTGRTLSYQDISYKNTNVFIGDTLWSIAKEEQRSNPYYEGKDIRDVIENIKEINQLKDSNLSVNQTLKIPIY